jgi:hypothetical protein
MWLFRSLRRYSRSASEWHDHDALFFTPRLNDGSELNYGDHVMRRLLPDGTWEYRKATPEEAAEFFSNRQW